MCPESRLHFLNQSRLSTICRQNHEYVEHLAIPLGNKLLPKLAEYHDM